MKIEIRTAEEIKKVAGVEIDCDGDLVKDNETCFCLGCQMESDLAGKILDAEPLINNRCYRVHGWYVPFFAVKRVINEVPIKNKEEFKNHMLERVESICLSIRYDYRSLNKIDKMKERFKAKNYIHAIAEEFPEDDGRSIWPVIKLQSEYIDLLEKECERLSSFAWTHGITCPPETVEMGNKLRADIQSALKEAGNENEMQS